MRQQLSDNISRILNGTTTAILVVVVLIFHLSCKGESSEKLIAVECSDSLPVMSTFDVNTIISDSGRISYKIIADEWRIYDKRKPPFWAFEKGVYLEKYDKEMNIEATVKCDTAYYYSEQELWKLIGNVNIKNVKDEKFYTPLMYWDQKEEKIYSDSYIKIEQADQVTEGIGFEANQNLTLWQINNTKGIFAVEE
ncbi:MAG: LPS export ABC transporter periplasmic protein LptC [Bacteroidaceae bacterium]|nr:LPS export ABC transporter periplasmic protein LptC [Bacteroidaceae bacterium]